MYITRNGVNIELTEDEREAAYQEQLNIFQRNDVASHLLDLYKDDSDNFKLEYGRTPKELSEDNDFLDSVIEQFVCEFDCNTDENTMWENAIQSVLSDMKG